MTGPKRAIAVLALLPVSLGGGHSAAFQQPELGRHIPVRPQLSQPQVGNHRSWGLNITDWHRYQSLMDGPRGVWSPGLDPILVLGVHAADEGERRRLAEQFVSQQQQRVVLELAFQRAVRDAMERRFDALSAPPGPNAPELPTGERSQHLLLFASLACSEACDPLLEAALRSANAGGGLDVYLSGASDDAALQNWALARGVQPRALRLQRVTMKHDRGQWQRFAGRHRLAGSPPRLLSVDRGTLQEIKP